MSSNVCINKTKISSSIEMKFSSSSPLGMCNSNFVCSSFVWENASSLQKVTRGIVRLLFMSLISFYDRRLGGSSKVFEENAEGYKININFAPEATLR